MFVSIGVARRFLLGYLQPQIRRVFGLGLFLAASLVLQLGAPQLMSRFLDLTQQAAPLGVLVLFAGGFLGLTLLQRMVSFAALYLSQFVGWQATNQLRYDLTHHVLQLDLEFHKRHTPGELIERVDGDVSKLANFFAQFSLQLFGNSLLIVGVLLILWLEDWRVGLALTVYTSLVFLVLFGLQSVSVTRWAAADQARADQFGFLEERISGTEDLRSNRAEGFVLQQLRHYGTQSLQRELAALMLSTLTGTLTRGLFVIGYVLGLIAGSWLWLNGLTTLGGAFVVVFYIGMLAEPIEQLQHQIEDWQQAQAALGRVMELFALTPQVRQPPSPLPLAVGPIQLEVHGLSFAYPDDPSESSALVLRDLSFQLEAGQVLGLLGRTGSGKTTLIRLINRLYDPTAGTIRLNGVDLRQLDLMHVRQRVALVSQDVQIFYASLRDNLTLFDPQITDQQVWSALEQLGLRGWVEALPEGLATIVGSGGRGLSAGEAQLLACTRVLLRDPSLIILDEASSRLDPVTEQLLEQAMDRMLAGRTAIIIAHRLQTVQRADQIMVLERGQLVEYGPRRELINQPESRFARLLAMGLTEVLA